MDLQMSVRDMPALGQSEVSLAPLAANCASMAAVLEQLGPERYCQSTRCGRIGPHVRHCLDHLQALARVLRRRDSGNDAEGDAEHNPQPWLIDYEQRRRGWCGEEELTPALTELADLHDLFKHCTIDGLQPVMVNHIIDPDQPTVLDQSSLGREAHYCLSHSVHHQAILALIINQMHLEGSNRDAPCEVPADFGYAPSTIANAPTKS
jgi:hypothetical protein